MEKDEVVKETSRSWIVAVCCFFTNFTFYGVSRLAGIMLVATMHSFNVSRARASVPYTLCSAVRSLTGVFVGHLGHHFGVGRVVAVGCLIASLGSGLCFFAKDMLWIAVCWGGVFGIGFGLCTCLLPLAINQNFSKHLGTGSGISYSGSYVGSFLFPPIVVMLLDTFALQGTFLIISSGILHVLIAALLLIAPKKTKKKSSSSSSGNIDKLSASGDTNGHQTSSTDRPYFIEASEIWKTNLHIAYMASRNGVEDAKYKQNFRHSISFADSPYFLQTLTYRGSPSSTDNCAGGKLSRTDILHCDDPKYNQNFRHSISFSDSPYVLQTLTFKRSSSSTDNNDGEKHSRTDIVHCEDPIHRRHFLSKLFQACGSKLPSEEESKKVSEGLSSCHSNHFINVKTNHLQFTKCSSCDNLPNKEDSLHQCAKPVWKNAKVFSKKHLENELPFRIKLKAKFKLKLQKLKKVLVASLLKHKSPYLKELVQNENVKLTSYRNLQPFLCCNASNLFIPSKCIYLSLPQNILGVKCSVNNIDDSSSINNGSLNSLLTLQYGTKIRERFNSLPVLEIKNRQGILPFFHGSSFDSSKFIVIPETKHDSKEITDCFSLSANKKQDQLLSLDTVSLDSSSAKNTRKNRTLKLPPNALNLSPELFLKGKTEFKSQKRKESWLHMFRDPVFVVIGFTMSIQTFILVSVVTTIEDYARDVGIPENKTHYALMALSIANLVGTLTLGSITDRGFISRPRFMSLCFLGMSVTLVALSLLASSLPSLLPLISFYGLLESGAIITFPLLTKEFVKGQRLQAIAIASSNVLSAPTIMLVPFLIGYFRDYIGSYVGLFQLLGATSITCSVLWMVTPSICGRKKLKKKLLHLNANLC